MNFNQWIQPWVVADVAVFRFINHTLFSEPLADLMFVLAQDYLILTVLLLGVAIYSWRAGWQKALTIALWGGVAVVCSNLLQNHLLKIMFHRTRPFLALPEVHLSAPLYNLATLSLSFPSTHASSAAALGLVAASLDKKLRWPAAGFAVLIGWGSIYTGGHYPLDVLVGYVFGSGLGALLVWISRKTWPGEQPE